MIVRIVRLFPEPKPILERLEYQGQALSSLPLLSVSNYFDTFWRKEELPVNTDK